MSTRELRSDDTATVDAVHRLNEAWVPHVGSVTRDRLVRIVDVADLALVEESVGPDGATRLDGFVIVLGPDADYDSPNHRWFVDRLDEAGVGPFLYVDRIAVSPHAQGSGVGRRLYEATITRARDEGAVEVTCEVNLDPPNPDSQAFHARMGFVEVGRQWTYDHTVQVQMLARPL